MRTSYFVRKNGWMSAEERLLARRIGRDGEKRLSETLMAGDAVSALVFYCAGCAAAVLGRVGARYMEMLAAGEDVSVMQEVFSRAQAGAMQSARAVEVLIAGRLLQVQEGERDWFGEVVLQGREKEDLDRIDRIYRMDKIQEVGEGPTMVGERVASREAAVGLAQGAMADLALVSDAERAGAVATLAARVPEDTHYALSAQLDEHMAAQQARMAAGTFYQDTTPPQEEASAEDFSHLPRRERRYMERLARKEARKGRRVAA